MLSLSTRCSETQKHNFCCIVIQDVCHINDIKLIWANWWIDMFLDYDTFCGRFWRLCQVSWYSYLMYHHYPQIQKIKLEEEQKIQNVDKKFSFLVFDNGSIYSQWTSIDNFRVSQRQHFTSLCCIEWYIRLDGSSYHKTELVHENYVIDSIFLNPANTMRSTVTVTASRGRLPIWLGILINGRIATDINRLDFRLDLNREPFYIYIY